MAWSSSEIFRAYMADVLDNTSAIDLGSDNFKVALYDNDITPDQNVTAANSAYNVGQWLSSGNELFEAGQWDVGGVALAGKVVNSATAGVVFWDANDTSSGGAADLAPTYGCLVYDESLATPVDNQGVCFTYFGGPSVPVVNSTLAVVWATLGIARITL